jgi:HAD superfamily hydrolase (TIGR01509 family)
MTAHYSPKAVIFDMDGVIFDTERLARELWEKVFADYGYTLTDDCFKSVIGRTIEDTMQIFEDAFGHDIPIQEMDEKQEALYQDYINKPLPFKPGVFELIAYLDAHNLPKAVGSSTYTDQVKGILARNDILQHFQAVVGGDEVKQGKPCPDIFLKAAEQLGVAPKDCLVLEDSENGIKAANNAGIPVLMIPDLIPPEDIAPAAHFSVVQSLGEVIGLLQ